MEAVTGAGGKQAPKTAGNANSGGKTGILKRPVGGLLASLKAKRIKNNTSPEAPAPSQKPGAAKVSSAGDEPAPKKRLLTRGKSTVANL